MGLMVDAIVSPVLFEEEEDTGLVELAIKPEDKGKYPFVHPSSTSADLMDRLVRVIGEWKNINFDELIQADPTHIDRI